MARSEQQLTALNFYGKSIDMAKAGRPKVKASEKRGETFRFMTTKEESAQIRANAKAAGLNLSEYLRRVALQKGE